MLRRECVPHDGGGAGPTGGCRHLPGENDREPKGGPVVCYETGELGNKGKVASRARARSRIEHLGTRSFPTAALPGRS